MNLISTISDDGLSMESLSNIGIHCNAKCYQEQTKCPLKAMSRWTLNGKEQYMNNTLHCDSYE